jgi:hypothetical protein
MSSSSYSLRKSSVRTPPRYRIIVAFPDMAARQRWLASVHHDAAIHIHSASSLHPWVHAEVERSALSRLRRSKDILIFPDA